ncbi:MAG: tyrosine-type recombinase/integrase, partial [Ignavibacteriales bacterium]
MASLVRNHGSYYAVFSVAGKKHWVKIGKVDKANAKKILKQLELAQTQNRLNLLQPKPLTLVEFIERYLDYAKANKASQTFRLESYFCKKFKDYAGDKQLPKIDRLLVEGYKAKLIRDGAKPASINRELAMLSQMLNKAIAWGYLDSNPFKGIKPVKLTKQPPKLLTQDEIDRLIDAASLWLKPMLIVLRNTGLRVHELLGLRWADIDFDRQCVTARSNKTSNYRVIPMTQELYQILFWLRGNYVNPKSLAVSPRQASQMDYVFCNVDGSKLMEIRHSFQKACRKAGIKASPHTLRHNFASYLIMNGVDLPSVKELLGHTQISTTMIYSHLS